MTDLVWLIPLSIWLLFILVVVPYRLTSKYKRQRDEARTLLTPKTKPLLNEEKLLKAIAEAQIAVVKYVKLKERLVVSQVNLPPVIKLMFHPFSQVN